MELGTFYQTCSYLCMCLIAVNLAFAFMIGLGVFGDINGNTGFQATNTSGVFGDITDVNADTDTTSYTGMDALWVIVGGSAIGLVSGLALGYLMHSSVFVGIGLFSGVFWSSYINSMGILSTNNFLAGLEGFVLIGTVLMVFMFAGAVIGMLSGSG